MAILQSKPEPELEGIPPMLQRNGKASDNDALLAKIAELEAKLAAKNNAKISLKVSEKGTVSAYGLGRFPVSLYRGQWERLLAEKDNILAFIEEHAAELPTK